jgi:hypothetical protein
MFDKVILIQNEINSLYKGNIINKLYAMIYKYKLLNIINGIKKKILNYSFLSNFCDFHYVCNDNIKDDTIQIKVVIVEQDNFTSREINIYDNDNHINIILTKDNIINLYIKLNIYNNEIIKSVYGDLYNSNIDIDEHLILTNNIVRNNIYKFMIKFCSFI